MLTDKEFDALCYSHSFGAVACDDFPLIPRGMLKELVDAAVTLERERFADMLTDGDVRNIVIEKLEGKTPKALAKELGISYSCLNSYLNFNREPGTKLLDALGMFRVSLYQRNHVYKEKPHKWEDENGYRCSRCGMTQDAPDAISPCEPEDLSMWCAPGQSVKDMLMIASERD